jgi:hypothetical protein
MTMGKLNARLEWRDKFSLCCNGIEVARMTVAAGRPLSTWRTWVGLNQQAYTYKSEDAARNAINRRFGLKEE